MTTSPSTSRTNTARRYYDDECRIDPALNLSDLKHQLHAAYTHWVAKNWHLRDFVEAVEHCATTAYASYAIDGHPQLTGDLPVLKVPALAPLRKKPADTPAIRFYDELNSLSPEIDLSMLEAALAGPFIHWLAQGWHARDYVQAAKDCAAGIVYDHQLCAALGGMGGCWTSEQFLSEAYRG